MDIFTKMPSTRPILNPTRFRVSGHHRTVVFIGPSLGSVVVEPVTRGGGKPYSILIKNGLDETSGIERRVIPLTRWSIIVLHRPPDSGRLNRYWCGTWRPAVGGPGARYEGRVYLIPDFLQVSTVGSGPDGPHLAFTTPTLVTITLGPQPKPVIPPQGFITPAARDSGCLPTRSPLTRRGCSSPSSSYSSFSLRG
jgi:hypothetical protein